MRIKTKNIAYYIKFEWIGFGYAKITGNKRQRKLYFIGIATIEAIDRREYPDGELEIKEWYLGGSNGS